LNCLYLDSSALVKVFVREPGTAEVLRILSDSELAGTALITKVELAAAFARLQRMNVLTAKQAVFSMNMLLSQWASFVRLELSDEVVEQGVALTRRYPLRGYDAVQLASAVVWNDAISSDIVFATFDKRLWQAAEDVGLTPFPSDLTPFLLP